MHHICSACSLHALSAVQNYDDDYLLFIIFELVLMTLRCECC